MSQFNRLVAQIICGVTSNYILRHLLASFSKILFIVTLTFFIIRLMPGNPVDAYINFLMAEYSQSYEDARSQAGALFSVDLDAPRSTQYMRYVIGLMHGDLGSSYNSPGTAVSKLIAKFMPWTLFSVGSALFISYVLGLALGMLMAFYRGSLLDHTLSIVASLLNSLPNYLIGMLLLVLLGVRWKVLPLTQMRGSLSPGINPGFTWGFLYDVSFHAFLPILTYVLTTIGGWMLTMRSSTISTLGEEYITVAQARGLKPRRLVTAYIGRNASLPLFAQLATSIGFIVGGSALIEELFVYRGVGKLLIDSIKHRDYPVIQGVFLVITISVILANFFADIVYSWLDPRIRHSR